MAPRRKSPGSKSNRDYEIGYGKPPRGKPFPPGKSGNPSGRRKKDKSVVELALKELDLTRRTVRNGKTISYKLSQVAGRQLAKKVAEADLAALRLIETAMEAPERRGMDQNPVDDMPRDPDSPLLPGELKAMSFAVDYFAYTIRKITGFEIWPARDGA